MQQFIRMGYRIISLSVEQCPHVCVFVLVARRQYIINSAAAQNAKIIRIDFDE